MASTFRVKLYCFDENTREWNDVGTGRVSLTYIERLQGVAVIIRSEVPSDHGALILESLVTLERLYQKKEETLIMWTEENTGDLAVSFEDKKDCNDIWYKICEYQGKDPNDCNLSEDGELSEPLANSSTCIELPPCELSKLEEIYNVISSSISAPLPREALALVLERENYVQKLLELFNVCEDLENIDGLHLLYNIFRTLFLLNRVPLLSVMFLPKNIMSVIGCLEYDPGKPQPIPHRKYLVQTSQYREVVPFNNSELLDKIHLTYKMCYIQEVILPTPSLFEENMMSAFNSLVLFNKSEIVNSVQDDGRLLYELLSTLKSDSTPLDKYREYALFLRELCTFAQALEMENGTKFYQRLCAFELMGALENMLSCEVADIVGVAVDIISQISDYNLTILRDHMLKQNDTDEDTQFLNVLIGLLVDAQFTSIDVQLVGLIRTLIDPENIMTDPAAHTVEKTIFLNYYYKHCMHKLMAPLMSQTTGDKICKDTAQNAVLLSHILDLLSVCVEKHSHYIRKYIIDKNLLGRVLVLMTSSHRHLTLAALRFCRKVVGLKDEFYNRYLIKHNLFSPIIKTFTANGQRYNLVNSAIIELFEFIKAESITPLIVYIVENFMETLEEVKYVPTFQAIKLKYEQGLEKNNRPPEPAKGIIHGMNLTRFRRDPRELDEDEENWFDDEEEGTVLESTPPPPSLSSLPRITPSSSSSSINNNTPIFSGSPRPTFTRSPSPILPIKMSSSISSSLQAAVHSLVDYDDDSDDEEEEKQTNNVREASNSNEKDLSPSSSTLVKRQKLDNT